MSKTFEQFEEETGDVWKLAQAELLDATENFLFSCWSAVESRFSFWNALSPEATLTGIWEDWAKAMLAFTDDLTDVPIRALTRAAAVSIPLRPELDHRVMKAGDAYRFAAATVVESALDLVGGRPLPTAWGAYKGLDAAINRWNFIRYFDVVDGLKVIKGTIIGRILTLCRITFHVLLALTVLAVLWAMVGRSSNPAYDTDLPALSQDSKRVWGGKRRQHRQNREKGPDK